jgi:hypothetical protein
MQRPEALGPTAPSHPPIPVPPPPSSSATMFASRRNMAIAIAAALALFLLMTGILIGRATKSNRSAALAAGDKLAQLAVSSKPVDANVLVDGRFVGVCPVDRIDLDAGKHSVVIDAFGYQPYAGTLEVEAEARASLKVVLAPIGGGSGTGTTSGELVGRGGKYSPKPIPQTALAPVSLTGTGTSKDAAKKKPSGGGGGGYSSYSPPPTPTYEPPPRPRRDCSNEKSQCRDNCSRTNFSCRSDCPNCVSCPSSVGSEMCRQQCDSCRNGCEQNVKFCESSCDSNYNSCQASNN